MGFTALSGTSRRYKVAVAALALLALAGLVSFAVSYLVGHRVFGGNNLVPWGQPIVLAIYLIGLSAGSLILSSLTYVFGREEYRPAARLAVFLAIVLIMGAMIAIAVDLGRPEKFWRLFVFFFMSNPTSMFALNGLLYGGYFVISLVYLGLILAGSKLTRPVGILAVGWAVLVHMGTGAIFGFIAARETWFSPLKPFEFLTAALTSGLALLMLVILLAWRLTGRGTPREMLASLGKLLAGFIIVLLAIILVDKLTHLYAPAGREATVYMLAGRYSWLFWGFQVGLGAVLPLAVLAQPRWRRSAAAVSLAAAAVVIGVYVERYYLVIPGAAFPMPLYPGEIQGVWGAAGVFAIRPVETLLTVGILALVALVFILGLKYLELLPESHENDNG